MPQLNPSDIADDIIVNANVVDPNKAPEVALGGMPLSPLSSASEAPQALFSDEATRRHGRIAGKSLGIGYKRATGQELEDDVSGTFGEAMGEVFGAINGMGNKLFYWGLLAASMAPVFVVIISEILKVNREVKE